MACNNTNTATKKLLGNASAHADGTHRYTKAGSWMEATMSRDFWGRTGRM